MAAADGDVEVPAGEGGAGVGGSMALASDGATAAGEGATPGPNTSLGRILSGTRRGSKAATEAQARAMLERQLLKTQFTPRVEETMKAVLGGSENELDDPAFDPVAYINAKFPTEESLEGIDAFLVTSADELQRLDADILHSVRDQALHGAQARQDIADAKASITELFSKIMDIKDKARQSDAMVQDICADIKQLDVAKRHLTTTITALRRLQMLKTAVDRLQDFAKAKQYQDAATLLEATTALFTQFEDYADVPKIAELHNNVNRVKRDLKRQIYEDFDVLTEASVIDADDPEADAADSPLVELRHACAVVDALPIEVRQTLLKTFFNKQFSRYDDMYGSGSQGFALELVDRRYSWFRSFLREYDTRFANVLPTHWDVSRRMCIRFCEKTRADIDLLLSAFDPPDSAPPETLVRQLNKTLAFEAEMVTRFESGRRRPRPGDKAYLLVAEDGDTIDPDSAEGVRRRYAAQRAQESAAKQEEDESASHSERAQWLKSLARKGADVPGTKKPQQAKLPSVKRAISAAFDPYMGAYVKFERAALDAYLSTDGAGEGDPDGVDRAGDVPLFASSIHIFMKIKSCIKRCTQLNTGQTFFHLSREFKAVLLQYAAAMEAKLPVASSSSTFGETYSLSPETLELACVIVNTAEYCSTTVPQLEDLIKHRIDDAFSEHVSLEEANERFMDVMAIALKVVSHGLACVMDPQLTRMTRTKWESCQVVGDVSTYVVEINETFTSLVPRMRMWLTDPCFRTMCEKFVRVFVPRYQDSVRRCRKVGELGGHQLRIDANAMKTILTKIPTMGGTAEDEENGPSLMYTNYLARQMPKVELLLTCVALAKEALADSIRALWPEADVDDVIDIMHMKNLKSREQTELLSSLGMSASDARRQHSAGRKLGDVTSNMMSTVTKGFDAFRK